MLSAVRTGFASSGNVQYMTPPSRTEPTVAKKSEKNAPANAREKLIANLNEDLAREYQALAPLATDFRPES